MKLSALFTARCPHPDSSRGLQQAAFSKQLLGFFNAVSQLKLFFSSTKIMPSGLWFTVARFWMTATQQILHIHK